MGKLTLYLLMLSGIMLLFYFGGLLQDTPNSLILDLILKPENYGDSIFANKLLAIFTGLTALASVAIGIALRSPELGLLAAFSVYLFNLAWDFISVFNIVRDANPVFALLIFSPLFLIYMLTVVEWWRGRD